MKVVFFGTPKFSAEIFESLVEKGVDITAVVTQPDKLQGRHLKLQESAVKKAAKTLLPNIPLLQPEKISNESFVHSLTQIEADLYVVVAFGQIFPKVLLDMPPKGCVNVHTSLLPKYRGAAPIQRCIINGETETGCTIMYMAEKCDAGDILAMKKLNIAPSMNAGELSIALCELSKDLLYSTLLKVADDKVKPVPQDHSQKTFAKKVNPADAEIKWDLSAEDLYNLYRGVTPKPGAWCTAIIKGNKRRLKLIDIEKSPLSGKKGEIIEYGPDKIVIACKEHSLSLKVLQVEGKKALQAHSFVRGCNLNEISFSTSESSLP
ncbi:MAG: Methionyl-tRNA formyltransferase [Chlamydiae bacterium]|nr:Methionyl-tRNA formyltransferase [Chlamydiota bacterium]